MIPRHARKVQRLAAEAAGSVEGAGGSVRTLESRAIPMFEPCSDYSSPTGGLERVPFQ
jgi:hypothetical protein